MCIATLTLNSIKSCSRLALCYQHDWQGVHLVNSNAPSCTNLMCSVNYASTRHQWSVTWVPWVDLAAIIKELAACLTLVALLGSASSEGLFDLTGWPPRLTSIASRMSSLQCPECHVVSIEVSKQHAIQSSLTNVGMIVTQVRQRPSFGSTHVRAEARLMPT